MVVRVGVDNVTAGLHVFDVTAVGPDGGAIGRGGEGKNWLRSKNVTARSSTTEEALARAGARSRIGRDRCHVQIKYLFHHVGTSSIFVCNRSAYTARYVVY